MDLQKRHWIDATLIRKEKKQVLLINSAEYGKFYKNCLFYNSLYGNYMQDNMDLTEIDWKDVKVPYVQCDNDTCRIPRYWICC